MLCAFDVEVDSEDFLEVVGVVEKPWREVTCFIGPHPAWCDELEPAERWRCVADPIASCVLERSRRDQSDLRVVILDREVQLRGDGRFRGVAGQLTEFEVSNSRGDLTGCERPGAF